MLGVIGDIALAPRTGHDDNRTDISELAGDRLVQQRSVGRFTRRALGPSAEDDGVKRLVRAGDVDIGYAG